ncbi:isocitrate lyase/PEP mutase family protein [Leucobacter japonicus]|uniref:isocitrate lyase/PEP mutase family protein n=1 Tax=Leucobacter japonicus TaxID=1461259 RepID=UPI0006A77EDB|nr:isocitrate lyase/phosphoenolpyruvate mutase family protein [Leucobacter japonicus]
MHFTTTDFAAAARTFRALHTDPKRPLLLANAWDSASARIIENAGASAIATTSAGVAWSLGRPDGNALTRDESMAAIARIAGAVSVPVTADLESGYGTTPTEVGETVRAAIDAGAVGINLEDGTQSPDDFADRLTAARAAADRTGVSIFINARTDVFLGGPADPEHLESETATRAARYVGAGADGIFVPGVTNAAAISALVAAIDAPLNVMVGAGSPSVATLASLGVARVSLGSNVIQAAYAVAQRAARELWEQGTYESVGGALEYGEIDGLFAQR